MKPPGDGSPPGDDSADADDGRGDGDDELADDRPVDDQPVDDRGGERSIDADHRGGGSADDADGADEGAAGTDGGRETPTEVREIPTDDGSDPVASSDDGPPAKRAADSGDGPEVMTPIEFLGWLRTTDHGGVAAVREMLSTAAIVLLVGALLFGVSGVWPPMVAIESGSMTPHMQVGDLVFVMDEDRLQPAAAQGTTGVVTYQSGESAGYRTFQSYGDVVVYRPDGSVQQTPIIHRARFWVEEGENWYQTKADPEYVSPNYRNCEQLPACPAPHAGFVTKGDNNDYYDQAIGMSSPVRPTWVTGTAEFRIPWLGCIRLGFPPGCLAPPQTIPGSWVVLGVLAVLAIAASSIERE